MAKPLAWEDVFRWLALGRQMGGNKNQPASGSASILPKAREMALDEARPAAPAEGTKLTRRERPDMAMVGLSPSTMRTEAKRRTKALRPAWAATTCSIPIALLTRASKALALTSSLFF